MAYRLSMVPRVAQRFGVHLRPHAMSLVAHLARRIGLLCLVVGALSVVGPSDAVVQEPVLSAHGLTTTVDGVLTDPAVPPGVVVEPRPGANSDALITLDGGSWVERNLLQGRGTLTWLCVGAAAWWLAPLLRTFAVGDPFDRGNPRRLRGIALAVLVASHVAPLLPPLGMALALDRLGLSGDFSAVRGFPLHTSILFVALLLLLAGALRQGRSLQDDVAGLV